MHYQRVGDWNLSRVGLGCYALSGAYGNVDQTGFERTIRTAFDQGVNFFDTAEGYNDAEVILGKVLAPIRDQVYIATKLSGESGSPDLTAPAVRAACEASLQRLATEVIDLYQIHFDDPGTPVSETVSALDALVEDGLIRRYGVSHLPVERVKEFAQSGHLFSILMELSPVARTARHTLLPICTEHNLAAIAFSITGRGILSGHFSAEHGFEEGDIRRMDPLFKRDLFISAQRIRRYLASMVDGYGASALQIGIAWVLAQPGVACALTGTSSPVHLAENLAACAIEFEPGDLEALDLFLDDEDDQLKTAQSATIRKILYTILPEDAEAAFNDLVYVMETAVMLDLVRESDLMGTFMTLLALRKKLDTNARQNMASLQQDLRSLLDEA